jgi:hypothetical protein
MANQKPQSKLRLSKGQSKAAIEAKVIKWPIRSRNRSYEGQTTQWQQEEGQKDKQ